ncbi:uncharacterized protein HNQ56_003165 [Anaerotaenia torta]|uniref:HD domain-containing protein n=1 Tax=Anaerotaenia torta TaxID=433293 RepID=UPI003D1DD8B0
MRTDIIDYLKNEVYLKSQKPENKFGIGCYYHIEAVVKNAELLADKYGADKEIVIIAAWLHDIASISDYNLYELHHIHGARMAGEILTKFGYEKDKIALVQECIRNHRGSVDSSKDSLEELCVADADAISHFDNIPSLLYLAYVNKNMKIEDGKIFVKNKLERSFQKLSEESKGYYTNKYRKAMLFLG